MFSANFSALKQLVDQLTAKDLDIPPDLMITKSFVQNPTRAPVKYLDIFEHQTFTMSVFIIANNYTMPLHDHPGHGLLRVISGMARIQSYSLDCPLRNTLPDLLAAYEETPVECTARSECSILTPTKCNIHDITAIGNSPAAFFDILSPPYESELSELGPKRCLFYRKLSYRPTTTTFSNIGSNTETISQAQGLNRSPVYLQRIRVPSHYHCEDIPYEPPEFLNEI